MKSICLMVLLAIAADASDYSFPKCPEEPPLAAVLEANRLNHADELQMLNYLEENLEALGFCLTDVREREEQTIRKGYFKLLDSRSKEAPNYFSKAIAELQHNRLSDPRRIADAVLRTLGKKGTENSLPRLLSISTYDERKWVGCKVLASVAEILTRIDPTQLDDRSMMHINAAKVAPLLHHLDPEVAARWAWTLWPSRAKRLGPDFPEEFPPRTRILLAYSFASSHPAEAAEVFEQGLRSHDFAIRTAAEMAIRSGIGCSIPYETPPDKLLEAFKSKKWVPNSPPWEALPLPLDQPLPRKNWGGRRDLIWLGRNGNIEKQTEDVWPELGHSLNNGLFYTNSKLLRLLDKQGGVHARFETSDWSGSSVTPQGGLWAFSKYNRAAEFFPDGTLAWEFPITSPDGYSEIAAIGSGKIVLLGYKFLECRDLRGDLLWRTHLEKLNDPHEIIPISENRFLLSCSKSVGWLSKDGEYEPILTGLGSADWIRYHPKESWVVMDGATNTAIIYDPVTRKETGRFDLDDGGSDAKSSFLTPTGYLLE